MLFKTLFFLIFFVSFNVSAQDTAVPEAPRLNVDEPTAITQPEEQQDTDPFTITSKPEHLEPLEKNKGRIYTATSDLDKTLCEIVRNRQVVSADLPKNEEGIVPADLNPSLNTINDPLIIPIEIDLAERFGITAPEGVDLDTFVAAFEVSSNGTVNYQGRDLTNEIEDHCNIGHKDGVKQISPLDQTQDNE